MSSDQGHPLAVLRRTFTRSAWAVIAVNGSGLLLLFLSQIVLARVLGVEQYGIYTYLLSCLGIMTLLGKFGLDQTLQRFVPEYVSRDEWGFCRGVLLRSYQLVLLVCLLLAVLLYELMPYVLATVAHGRVSPGMIMLAILPVWVLLKVTQGALLAFRRPVMSHLTENVTSPVFMTGGALLVAVSATVPVNALSMLQLFLVATGLSLLLGLYFLFKRAVPGEIGRTKARYRTAEWLRVALPLFVMSGMYVIMSYTDIVMLGQLSGTTDAGIYAAASRLAAFVALPLMFLNTVLTPYISGLFHSDRHAELQYVVTLTSRLAGMLALPACLILALFGAVFLGLFGNEFLAGTGAMNILLVGQLVNVLSGSVGFLMSMTGRHSFASATVTLCALLNILLNYWLIPLLGIEGAAVATAATTVLCNVIFIFSTRSTLNIRPTFFAALRPAS